MIYEGDAMLQDLYKIKESRLLLDVSLWSGDLVNMEASIEKTRNIADVYHLDVADAHFVPGLLFFPDFVKAIDQKTNIPLNCHLMMEDPFVILDDFIEAGADIITVHVELGREKLERIIKYLKSKNILVGLCITVETDVHDLVSYFNEIDHILLMGTKIGIKGVGQYPSTPQRVKTLKQLLIAEGCDKKIILSVDGGIRDNTVPELRMNGADMVTPGSLVFGSDDLQATVEWLKALPCEV